MFPPRFARLISRLFAQKARTHRPPVPRLRLDRLEDREVPATWKPGPGSDYLATTAANWDFGYGESISYFRQVTFNSANTGPCLDFAGDFDAINVNPGYTGTITLNGDLTVAMFYQGDGTIDQPLGSGSEITITQWWGWEGGTLNSTSTASSVTFDGSLYPGMASATIAPANAGTVYLGSTLNFVGGAVATFLDGTIDAINDPDVNLCQAQVAVTVQSNVNWTGIRCINLTQAQDSFVVTGPGTFGNAMFPVQMYNNNGAVVIQGGGTVILGGQVTIGALTYGSYYQLGTGALTIESGSMIKTSHGVQIAAGVIATKYNANLPNTVAGQTATIDGPLYGTGGKLTICVLGVPKNYGTLSVLGSVSFEGTFRYEPGVDGATSGRCDLLLATGNITINQLANSTATVAPVNSAGANTINNGIWRFLKTTGAAAPTITGTFLTANMTIPGQPPRTFQLGTVGNPVTELILTT